MATQVVVLSRQEQVSKLQKDAMARERMLQAALTKAQNDASAMSQELKKQQAGTSQPVNPPQVPRPPFALCFWPRWRWVSE